MTAEPQATTSPRVWRVSDLNRRVRGLLDADRALADVWVEGEVSGPSYPPSGHCFFTLKDAHSQIRAVLFREELARATVRPEHGAQLVCHGRVRAYEPQGVYQLYVESVTPVGAGDLHAQYEALRARLAEEGLFDDARKRPLPRFPRTIGVVTSESGAVFHDICQVLARRWPLASIVLAPAPVQGPMAVSGIVGGLEQLNARGDIDVIIVGRGGGSLEELWAFNEEPVARAIFASAVPVISAVGHETDTTIADFVADRRAPTPSAAAEIAAPDRFDVRVRLGVAAGTMHSVLRQQIGVERENMRFALRRAEHRVPDLNANRQRIDDLARRSTVALEARHRDATHGVGGCVWRLRALDPFATLERGYAIVQRGDAIVSNVDEARPGDAIDVRLRDGSFGAHVDGAAPKSARAPRRRVPEAQAPLFTMPEERA